MLNKMFRWFGKNRLTQDGKCPQRRRVRVMLEQLEIRELLTGSISLSSGVLLLQDTGAPTITAAYNTTTHNYTITDSNGLSGSISGWTISSNTATETDGQGASITQVNFTTTNGIFGTSSTGIAAAPTAVVTITDASAAIGSSVVTIDNLSAPSSTSLNIPSGDTLTVSSTTSTTFAGNFTGAGNLAVTDTNPSVFSLSGTNTFTGTTTVSTGTLEADSPASLAGLNTLGKITVADNATLAVQFGGTGQFAAADVTTLRTNATFSNGAGTATLGLDVTGSNTATYSPAITDPSNFGSLAVEKLGTGTLTLSGANSFTGGLRSGRR
jgi:autotransporter-associated beta strand protein